MKKIKKKQIPLTPPKSFDGINFSKGGRKQKPELLAPAGNLEKMKTAFAFGADAVYAGIPDFSLRVRINDFDLKSLAEGIEYAHKLKKKFYVTLNIFAHNRHIEKLPAYVKKLKAMKPDALIVSDPGIMMAVKKSWPEAVFHLSTQANCTNWPAAKFWYEQGFERVILGREVTLDEIKEIRKKIPKLEIETFVHGAMCMAYSGRCFLSKYLTNRSGNQGDCVQACRWQYRGLVRTERGLTRNFKSGLTDDNSMLIKPEGREEIFELVEEEHGSYILNSQDMNLIWRIPEMIEAGICSLKIEGRAKSVYYLAQVIWAYRTAIDMVASRKSKPEKSRWNLGSFTGVKSRKYLENLYKELEEKLVHRGYTEGFMFGEGQMAQNLENSHNKSEWEFCGSVTRTNADFTRIHADKKSPHPRKEAMPQRGAPSPLLVKEREHKAFVKVHNSLRVGDEIEILAPFCDIIKMKIKRMIDAKTNEALEEAHGGQKKIIIIESKEEWPEFSVIRRKLK